MSTFEATTSNVLYPWKRSTSTGHRTKRVPKVGHQTRTDALLKIAPGFECSRPGERKTCVICYHNAYVFDNQSTNGFGMTGRKLVGIDSAQGISQQLGPLKPGMDEETL